MAFIAGGKDHAPATFTRPIGLKLTAEWHERLKAVCRVRRLGLNETIRTGIQWIVEELEKK